MAISDNIFLLFLFKYFHNFSSNIFSGFYGIYFNLFTIVFQPLKDEDETRSLEVEGVEMNVSIV